VPLRGVRWRSDARKVESYEDTATTLGKKDGNGVKIAVIFQSIGDDCDDGDDRNERIETESMRVEKAGCMLQRLIRSGHVQGMYVTITTWPFGCPKTSLALGMRIC
jgi:hypothetical protein